MFWSCGQKLKYSEETIQEQEEHASKPHTPKNNYNHLSCFIIISLFDQFDQRLHNQYDLLNISAHEA